MSTFHVTAKQLEGRTEEAITRAKANNEHLLMVFAAFRVSPETIKSDSEAILDRENLLSITPPGCYICELVWGDLPEQCPGDPIGYDADGTPRHA